ncbi:hypothetical protein SFR_1925 [Streptomyces sp. FR-008]|nr:hypothetical protein SFR_1925 [Streptomyces sp. FR-008]
MTGRRGRTARSQHTPGGLPRRRGRKSRTRGRGRCGNGPVLGRSGKSCRR